ncbi:hypothetical protein B0H14DRAFT_2572136 [Mycena olivaceomarginata]|nr:hypothetical protein B0H14DRAFT_2572136 [Mycena olivaceomarginata]
MTYWFFPLPCQRSAFSCRCWRVENNGGAKDGFTRKYLLDGGFDDFQGLRSVVFPFRPDRAFPHFHTAAKPVGRHGTAEPPTQLAASLPTKTIPVGTSLHPKKAQEKAQERKKRAAKKRRTNEPETSNSTATTPAEPSNTADEPKEVFSTFFVAISVTEYSQSNYRNPIRLFFEDVTETNHGKPAEKGGKFYRCYHGESKKILKMSKAMRSSLNGEVSFLRAKIESLTEIRGLTGHLKSHAEDMYQLFEILKSRGAPATSEEIEIAKGKKTFSSLPARPHHTLVSRHSESHWHAPVRRNSYWLTLQQHRTTAA